MVDPNGQRVKI